MKAYLVSSTAAAVLLLGTSFAASPKNAGTSHSVAMEYDVRTAQWKPARPKPVVPVYAASTSLPPPGRTPWTFKRVAMQPVRFLVMAAKIPLIPAGFIGVNGFVLLADVRGAGLPFVDFAPAFENFDPGPAIDADLNLRSRRTAPAFKDDGPPPPLKAQLQLSRATPAAAPARSSLAGKSRPGPLGLDLILTIMGAPPVRDTEFHLAGPLVDSTNEPHLLSAKFSLSRSDAHRASAARGIAIGDVALTLSR